MAARRRPPAAVPARASWLCLARQPSFAVLAGRGIAARDETFHHAIARFVPHTGLILSRATSTIRHHHLVRLTMKRALQLAEILHQGMAAHRQGRLAEAERSYQAALDVKRDDFDSLHLLGVLRWQQRRDDEASRLIKLIATDRPLLDSIRSRLLQNRETSPRFDVASTCRDIEAAYVAMWKTYRRGESPRSFRVQPN